MCGEQTEDGFVYLYIVVVIVVRGAVYLWCCSEGMIGNPLFTKVIIAIITLLGNYIICYHHIS